MRGHVWKLMLVLLLFSGCVHSDYDFNPTTMILKQLIKGKNETQ